MSAKIGYLEGDGGRLFRTANTGKSWTELFSAGTTRISDMAFGSAAKGYLVSRAAAGRARSLRTTRQRRDVGAAGRRQRPDRRRRHRHRAGRDRLPARRHARTCCSRRRAARPATASTLTIKTPKTKLKKAATITVTGKLSAGPGRARRDRVVPAGRLDASGSGPTVKTASTGSFTTSLKVRKGTNRFVAQWSGDELRAGDGTSGAP